MAALLFSVNTFSQNRFPSEVPAKEAHERELSREEGKKFRGKREFQFEDVFEVRFINVSKAGEGKLNVDVGFSQSINPNSVTVEKLLINGNEVSSDTTISFSRNGGAIRINTPAPAGKFTLVLEGIESSKGLKIKRITWTNLCDGYKLHYKKK